MFPYLFHIGPLYFNMFGLCIALGLIIFLWAVNKDKLTQKYFKPGELSNLTLICVASGVAGGRILNILQHPSDYQSWYDIIAIWEGGLSLQGAIIAIVLTLLIYTHIKKIRIMPLLDIAGMYAPLLQSISRMGCFFAGCCYGYPSCVPWAITYSHPDTRALVGISCHPTQLYSVLGLFLLFIIIRFGLRNYLKKPGQLMAAYLIGASIERLINDFFRAAHYEEKLFATYFSSSQIIALCLLAAGLLLLIITSTAKTKPYST